MFSLQLEVVCWGARDVHVRETGRQACCHGFRLVVKEADEREACQVSSSPAAFKKEAPHFFTVVLIFTDYTQREYCSVLNDFRHLEDWKWNN